jgi:hypothetical protein
MKMMKSLRISSLVSRSAKKTKIITQPGIKLSISRHDDSRKLRNKKPGSAGGCEFRQLSCDPDRLKKNPAFERMPDFFMAPYVNLPE